MKPFYPTIVSVRKGGISMHDEKFAKLYGLTMEEVKNKEIQTSLAYARFTIRESIQYIKIEILKTILPKKFFSKWIGQE